MFAFGYGRGNCPPPFNLRRHRPQKPNAERTTQEAREREEKAETKEKMWRQQKKKKVCIFVDQLREVLRVL